MNNIYESIIQIYKECDIHAFPFDCIEILNHYGYRVYTYDDLYCVSLELYEMCIRYSDDSFVDKKSKIIAYNNRSTIGRIRFSLMHELGHHMLGHLSDDPQNEQEASCFASNILAPRIAIYYAKCQNAADVHKCFGLSLEASKYAFIDYCKWKDNIFAHNRKMSYWDKEIYNHFYNASAGKFVWRFHNCEKCHNEVIYNSFEPLCAHCQEEDREAQESILEMKQFNEYLYNWHSRNRKPAPEQDINFLIAEARYLYGYDGEYYWWK